MEEKNKKKSPETVRDILLSSDWFTRRKESAKYVTKEYQQYGLEIASRLNDMEHRSLYIKLAKEEDRNIIERAIMFTMDYPKVQSRARVFMWKLKEIRAEIRAKESEEKNKQLSMI
jgi:hypothetical protein